MKRLLLIAALLVAPAASADESLPLFFSRETIAIQRHALATSMPWQETQPTEGQPPAPAPLPPAPFTVEVRDAQSYYNQKDWFTLSSPEEDTGVLLVFGEASQSPIIPTKYYVPLDILFIDSKGSITQILPNILLSNLAQQIVPQNPVLAFLFLKGGTCERASIKPGDIVDYKVFNKPPLVLGDPVMIMDERKVQASPARHPAPPSANSARKPAPLPQIPPLPVLPGKPVAPQLAQPELPRAKKLETPVQVIPLLNTPPQAPLPVNIPYKASE